MPARANPTKKHPEPIVIAGERWRLVAFIALITVLVAGGIAVYVLRTEHTRSEVEQTIKPNLCQDGNDASCVRLLNRLCREKQSCEAFLNRLIASATPAQKRRLLRVLPQIRRQLEAQLRRGSGGAGQPGSRAPRGPSGRVVPRSDDVPGDNLTPGDPGNGGGGGGGSGGGGSNPPTPSLPNVPSLPSTPDTPDLPDTPDVPRTPLLPPLPDVLDGVGKAVDGVLPERVCVLAACTDSAPAPAP